MSLTLDRADEARLAAASATLLQPLAHPSIEAWAGEVSARTRAVVGADRVAITLPLQDRSLHVGPGYPAEVSGKYVELTEPMQRRYRFVNRGIELGAYDRARLWGPTYPSYRNSAYFQEYIRPYRMFLGVGLMIATEGAPSLQTVAQLIAHTDRPMAPDAEDRAARVLALLLPAFRSGVHAARAFGSARSRLAALVDRLGVPLALFSEAGDLLHRTPDLAGRDALLPAMRALATCGGRPTIRVGDIVLCRAFVPPELGGGRPAVAVLVRTSPLVRSVAELGQRFGLTPRQAEVARLLVERRTDREIADTLGISFSTARRHAEAVLAKLGVSSRRDVRRRLHEPPSSK